MLEFLSKEGVRWVIELEGIYHSTFPKGVKSAIFGDLSRDFINYVFTLVIIYFRLETFEAISIEIVGQHFFCSFPVSYEH